jgi:hypothetical protein
MEFRLVWLTHSGLRLSAPWATRTCIASQGLEDTPCATITQTPDTDMAIKFGQGGAPLQNYARHICTLTADELESFVEDWVAQRTKDYYAYERWSGTGDMGRDVTGYFTDRRLEGPWDNFQCKQLGTKLYEKALFVELGKILMHAANGAYSLPRAYIFVAPKGVGRKVLEYLAHPARLQQAFLDCWDSFIACDLVQSQVVRLSPEIKEAINAFDFCHVDYMDAGRLAKDPACMPALVKWFGADPGQGPRGVVPAAIAASESNYLGQLVNVYNERGLERYADPQAALACPDVGPHLFRQRTRFFDAAAFDRFYRDSTPVEFVQTFRDEVHHGVVDVHQDDHPSKFARLNQVMKQAAALHASGVLGKHAGPQVKQGTCHMLANEGVMPWDI